MMMTDPIADMLTRIRNAGKAGHRWVDMPPSKLKVEIARLLKEQYYVFDYKVLDDGRHGVLRVYLKYHDGEPVIRHMERVSRPGRRRYVGKDDIPRVRNGLGMAILSTSHGVLSDRTARAEGVGGEVMALVW
ncbi:MAG: 30S ribosomal protein S8 [Longimicrobiales bacterium]|nr:30S ribosomal protein S8 [Longimicrobiales bacterium]